MAEASEFQGGEADDEEAFGGDLDHDVEDQAACYEHTGSPCTAVREAYLYLLDAWRIIGEDMGTMNPMWHGELSEQLANEEDQKVEVSLVY